MFAERLRNGRISIAEDQVEAFQVAIRILCQQRSES